jgi:hypothetical protein
MALPLFLASVFAVILSSVGINKTKAQEEIVFPKVAQEEDWIAKEHTIRDALLRKSTPKTSDSSVDSLELMEQESTAKEHGCRVEKSYNCKGEDCEKEYKSKCFERGK